jgi:methylmalonyl-CoA mutase
MNSTPWADFPASTRSQWENSARQELNGENPFEKLKIQKGQLPILPYYDWDDTQKKDFFALPPATKNFQGAKAWVNTSRVKVNDAGQANEKALFHLNHGAEGILFELQVAIPNVSRLLHNIQLPYCDIYFSGNVSRDFLVDLKEFSSAKFDNESLNGCCFTQKALFETDLPFASGFRAHGIICEELVTAEETVANALKTAVSAIEKLRDYGHSSERALQQIAFQISCGTDLFHEIAKLRCLRALWNLVCRSYEISETPVPIQVVNTRWGKDYLQPHANLLKNASGSIAAILGGCDSLCNETEEDENILMDRMARNVSLLMREEAQLARVADPIAGSYYLETLTYQMMEKSWAIFKSIV